MSEILLYALVAGTLYSLVVLGYSLIYSVLGYVNFAHGEMLTISVYLCWLFNNLGFNVLLSISLSVILCGFIAFLLGKYLMVPARRRSASSALIVAIGISIIVQNIIALLFNADAKAFFPNQFNQNFILLNVQLKLVSLFSIIIAFGLLFITWYGLLKRTRIGLEIRACASNSLASNMFGLRQRKVFGLVFFISGIFAGLAGIAIGLDNHIITPTMGFAFGLRAFIASVIGGINNFKGAIAGAFILGLAENLLLYAVLSISFLNFLAPIFSKDIIAIFLLTIALFYKPTGLFTKKIELRP